MSERTGYHHGDLRHALLTEGRVLLAEQGPDAFSLSELARRVGVSAAAPYRHFADRNALVDAICDEGYVVFNDAMKAEIAVAKDPGDAVRGVIRAYLTFAAEYPTQFAVMFRDRDGRPHEVGPASFATFINAVAAAQSAGYLDPDVDLFTIARPLWSAVHGAATLTAAGAFDKLGVGVDREQMVTELAQLFVREPLAR